VDAGRCSGGSGRLGQAKLDLKTQIGLDLVEGLV
jgi:hypothetical protein